MAVAKVRTVASKNIHNQMLIKTIHSKEVMVFLTLEDWKKVTNPYTPAWSGYGKKSIRSLVLVHPFVTTPTVLDIFVLKPDANRPVEVLWEKHD